jgi:hypothetical protein
MEGESVPKKRRNRAESKAPPETVWHGMLQNASDGLLLVFGIGLMFVSARVEEWAAPSLGPDGRSIAHVLRVLCDIYLAIRLVGTNAFAVAEALVIRTTDLLVLLGRSWYRVRKSFRGEVE